MAAGVISSVGVHTEREWGFTPVDGYDKNVTYSNGRCPARALMDQLLEFVQAWPPPCSKHSCATGAWLLSEWKCSCRGAVHAKHVVDNMDDTARYHRLSRCEDLIISISTH